MNKFAFMEETDQEAGLQPVQYFLVYYNQHVFPALRSNMNKMAAYLDTLFNKDSSIKVFCIQPWIYKLLHLELILDTAQHQFLEDIPRLVRDMTDRIDVRNIILYGPHYKGLQKSKMNQAALTVLN